MEETVIRKAQKNVTKGMLSDNNIAAGEAISTHNSHSAIHTPCKTALPNRSNAKGNTRAARVYEMSVTHSHVPW